MIRSVKRFAIIDVLLFVPYGPSSGVSSILNLACSYNDDIVVCERELEVEICAGKISRPPLILLGAKGRATHQVPSDTIPNRALIAFRKAVRG